MSYSKEDKAQYEATVLRLNERAKNSFAGGEKKGDPDFERNVANLFSLKDYLYSPKYGNKEDEFNDILTNAILPPMSLKEGGGPRSCFQQYRHEDNPSGDFIIWFRQQLGYHWMRIVDADKKIADRELLSDPRDIQETISNYSIADQGRKVPQEVMRVEPNENVTKNARKKDPRYASYTEETDSLVDKITMDRFYVELATHVISLRNRIAKGKREKNRIQYETMFHTRMIVDQTRMSSTICDGTHNRQIYLSLDAPLLEYTYRDMPKDLPEVADNDLKRNKEINPETLQSNAEEEIQTPFALWVLARYMQEVLHRDGIQQSTISIQEKKYKEEFGKFLISKGLFAS